MSQITLRNLPDSVEEAIRKRAAQRHISLNRAATELLEQALGGHAGAQRHRDLSDLAGTWSEKEADAFDRRTQELRSVDSEIWS
jgi:plasmid stability protein